MLTFCRAVIKCPSQCRRGNQLRETRLCLKREWEAYQHASIASSPFIRKMYDLIGKPEGFDDQTGETTPYLALEWMDASLQDIAPRPDQRLYALAPAIFEATMSSILAFGEAGLVDTGKHRLPPDTSRPCLV